MNRAPFQVLVVPYRIPSPKNVHYAIFKREPSTGGYWQGIAGGGKIGESPLEAAKRESFEEAGIEKSCEFIELGSCSMIPVVNICGFEWGKDVLVIPEYCFGVKVLQDVDLTLSKEHTEFKWLEYSTAYDLLYWDSNKTALWELNHRINCNL